MAASKFLPRVLTALCGTSGKPLPTVVGPAGLRAEALLPASPLLAATKMAGSRRSHGELTARFCIFRKPLRKVAGQAGVRWADPRLAIRVSELMPTGDWRHSFKVRTWRSGIAGRRHRTTVGVKSQSFSL